MNIIAEYRELFEKITVVKSQIRTHERELDKLAGTYAPGGMKGMDYSAPQVQSSRCVPDVVEVADKISAVNAKLSALRQERCELECQLQELDAALDMLGDKSYMAISMKIRGKSNRQIANELNYSTRHVKRIVKSAFDFLEKNCKN